jgi:hypothetical protein
MRGHTLAAVPCPDDRKAQRTHGGPPPASVGGAVARITRGAHGGATPTDLLRPSRASPARRHPSDSWTARAVVVREGAYGRARRSSTVAARAPAAVRSIGKAGQNRWQRVRHARDAVAHDLYSFRGSPVGARRSRRLAVSLVRPSRYLSSPRTSQPRVDLPRRALFIVDTGEKSQIVFCANPIQFRYTCKSPTAKSKPSELLSIPG